MADLAKPPTPQGISALLRKAGFNRVEFLGGSHEHTSGYKVRKAFMQVAAVEVHWWPSSLDLGPPAERQALWLADYAAALAGAGWRVDTRQPDKLTVTAREDS